DDLAPTIDPRGDDAVVLGGHHLVLPDRLGRRGDRERAEGGEEQKRDASHRNASPQHNDRAQRRNPPSTGIESTIRRRRPEAVAERRGGRYNHRDRVGLALASLGSVSG